ncbi:MAG: peptidoglycan-associated lipoprotein [Luteibaculaceae bacterium]|jgi:peptidoglycan-associated lipoprotein
MKKIGTLIVLVLGLSFVGFGQTKYTKSADELFKSESYFEAIPEYQKAYSSENSAVQKARIVFQIAESYRLTSQIGEAMKWYDKSINSKHPDAMQYYYYAEMLKRKGDFAKAEEQYNNFRKRKPNDNRWKMGLKSLELAKEWQASPTRHIVENELPINSSAQDYAPTFADKKNKQLVFTSGRSGSSGDEVDKRTGENFTDLWTTTQDKKGKWSEPIPLEGFVNTEHNEGSANFTTKRTRMYFTRCEYEKKEYKGCEIYVSDVLNGKFKTPVLVTEINGDNQGANTYGHPAISKKEDVIVFASDRPGGIGGKDLWMITYDKRAKTWSSPTNMGSKINTSGDEVYPFINVDGKLYFSSDGHIGIGGLDIFEAEYIGNNRWGNVTNMRYPMNSSEDDYGIVFNKTKGDGYLSSSRSGGRGKDDIYRFVLPPMEFVLQGTVMDKDSKNVLDSVSIRVVGSNGESISTVSDGNGNFRFEKSGSKRLIQENTSYSVQVTKGGYLVAKDQFSTVGVEESTIFDLSFILQSIQKNEAIEMPEVQYALGSFKLLENSKDSLNFLYNILKDNPTIVIELRAHTDARGDDASNMDLSQKRAESCVQYLTTKGIPAQRMQAKGYGESLPRFSEQEIGAMTTEAEKERAHQLNRRTEFFILKQKYTPAAPQGE